MTPRFAHQFAATSLLVALAACGTTVETPRGSGGSGGLGGAGGGAAGAGGASTTGSSSSGTTSGGCDAPPPEACPTTVQCVSPTLDCGCIGSPGAWSCSPGDPPSSLPSAAPAEGACCEEEGMYCGGFETCGPICHCKGGAWSCKTPVDCPPFACPSPVQTLAGEACPTRIGEVCEGTGTCHYTCICRLDPATGSAAWECTIPPC